MTTWGKWIFCFPGWFRSGHCGGRLSLETELTIAIAIAGRMLRRVDSATKVELPWRCRNSTCFLHTQHLRVLLEPWQQHLQILAIIRTHWQVYGLVARRIINLDDLAAWASIAWPPWKGRLGSMNYASSCLPLASKESGLVRTADSSGYCTLHTAKWLPA